ncbi:MAG: UbiD family decarboxylase [Hyphomicrobiaceae bacterium]|nr:MAG: UbiD family decarboxylase [Hyphomicrobiaceae bacterium]
MRPPFRDLRSWLAYLAETDRLYAARPGVSLKYELAAFSKRTETKRALIFPQPGGHAIPVVSNLLADSKWMADALGVPQSQLLARFQEAARNPLASVEVKSAPAQDVLHRKVDLAAMLPIPTHNALDSGAYITAGLMIARNPETGVQNISIHRCQVSGPDRLGVLLLPRHTMAYTHIAERKGVALEVAIVIGVDPATLLSSQAIAPLDFDELGIAGALHGMPVEVVKCVSNEVRVPAGAEIVIEGTIAPHEREPEGPFGEFPQYYGPRIDSHVMRVTAISHRKRPIFHTIVGGSMEHLILGEIPREATLLAHLQRNFPEVKDVYLPRGGVCRYHLVVQIEKRHEGQAKNIIMGAFGGHYDLKQVVVVDTDVNIHDPDEVQWAIATRFQADRDLIVVSGAQGSKLDPTARDGVSAKMGLDATKPLGVDPFVFTRISVPGQDEVDLSSLRKVEDAASVLA